MPNRRTMIMGLLLSLILVLAALLIPSLRANRLIVHNQATSEMATFVVDVCGRSYSFAHIPSGSMATCDIAVFDRDSTFRFRGAFGDGTSFDTTGDYVTGSSSLGATDCTITIGRDGVPAKMQYRSRRIWDIGAKY